MKNISKPAKKGMFIAIGVLIIAVSCGTVYLLTLSKVKEAVSVEAGSASVDVREFLKKEKYAGAFETNMAAIELDNPGDYEVNIKVGRKVYKSLLQVVDTVAPKAAVVTREIWNDEKLEAKDFVKDISDVTEVRAYFKEEPDFTMAGDRGIGIVLEDTSGNKTELISELRVKEDTEAPAITGMKNQEVYVDSKVTYKKGVTVTDNKDKEVQLVVDSSTVNLKKPGSYKVTYSATDSAGNTAAETVTVKVKKKPKGYVDPEVLDKLADGVLSGIIKDGMSKREKAYAIYKWTKSHIRYVDYSDKSYWMSGAYQGLKNRRGDCFNYASTAKVLLTRAGIENIDVVRKGGGHYWNMVNCGSGWYHFDATPRYGGGEFFMMTDAKLDAYSVKHSNSHIRDKSKYPATPKK